MPDPTQPFPDEIAAMLNDMVPSPHDTFLFDVEGEHIEAATPMEALLSVLAIPEPPKSGELWTNTNTYDLPPMVVDYVIDTTETAEIHLHNTPGCLEVSLMARRVT